MLAIREALDGLLPELALVHLAATTYHESIRRDPAGDDGFAQAPRRLDQHAVALGLHGVAREQHPRGFRGDELLHDDGHRHVGDALPFAICPGAIRLQRRPAALDGVADFRFATDAEVGLLLPREACRGAVLRG